MAGDIIIRKAKKDYVCMCCNHVIKAGEQYLDRIIFSYGKAVRHDRYHDECPSESATVKLFKKIADADGQLLVMDKYGTKLILKGVAWSTKGEPVVLLQEIDNPRKIALKLHSQRVKQLMDEKGDSII